MSVLICAGCGGTTNTATSDWLNSPDDRAVKCYVRWVNRKPEPGCGLETAGFFDKRFAKTILEAEDPAFLIYEDMVAQPPRHLEEEPVP